MTRVFTALVPPDAARDDLDTFLAPRRDAVPELRWSPIEQVHLTLAFFADVEDWRLDALLEGTEAAAARVGLGDVAIAGGGAFPDVDRAKVLWAGLDLDDGSASELDRLSAGCRTAGARAGADPDGGRFRPHLTVARSGRPTGVLALARVLDAYRGPTWRPEDVVVFASHLGEGPRSGARHEELARFPLGGGPRV